LRKAWSFLTAEVTLCRLGTFVEVVRGEGEMDETELGGTANFADRPPPVAKQKEVLINDAMLAATGPDLGQLEERHPQLRDRTQPVCVHVLPITPERASTSTS
jgi:class 3 adenylate cyclase